MQSKYGNMELYYSTGTLIDLTWTMTIIDVNYPSSLNA